MCTLIVIRKVFSKFPLVIASNRDENPDRPSADPRFWRDRPELYAPRDLVRAGTWMGVSRRGLFVGLTNRDRVKSQLHRASRGKLVANALQQSSALEAIRFVFREWTSFAYNGFHLVLADKNDAFLFIGDGERLKCEWLPDGITVLTAYGTELSHVPRAFEIERRLEALKRCDDASPESLDTLLNFHANHDPRAAVCVHDPNESHRTMSSMIIRANADWSAFETWYRNGPACSGPFGEQTNVSIK